MARCSVHGFENCPYHGGNARTPVGAFRFCACFANHDGRTACTCACGQCEVYRDELARGPVVRDIEGAPPVAAAHARDGCGELCVRRDRWSAQLSEVDTEAARTAIGELGAAATDLAIRAALEKAELVYFGELDRLSQQRAVAPLSSKQRRKKKSERGKVPQKCPLCDVTHPRSFHMKEQRSEAADAAIQDALTLLGEQGSSGQADPRDGDGDHDRT